MDDLIVSKIPIWLTHEGTLPKESPYSK